MLSEIYKIIPQNNVSKKVGNRSHFRQRVVFYMFLRKYNIILKTNLNLKMHRVKFNNIIRKFIYCTL